MSIIKALLGAFFNMCLLRSKPQDLPYSLDLLSLILFFYITLNFLLASTSVKPLLAVQSALIETVLIIILMFLILKINKKTNRWLKTLMAITGTGMVLSVLAIPVFILIFVIDPGDFLRTLALLLYLCMLVWNVAIVGHIFRYTLDTSLGYGVIYSILYILLTTTIIRVLVPVE